MMLLGLCNRVPMYDAAEEHSRLGGLSHVTYMHTVAHVQ